MVEIFHDKGKPETLQPPHQKYLKAFRAFFASWGTDFTGELPDDTEIQATSNQTSGNVIPPEELTLFTAKVFGQTDIAIDKVVLAQDSASIRLIPESNGRPLQKELIIDFNNQWYYINIERPNYQAEVSKPTSIDNYPVVINGFIQLLEDISLKETTEISMSKPPTANIEGFPNPNFDPETFQRIKRGEI